MLGVFAARNLSRNVPRTALRSIPSGTRAASKKSANNQQKKAEDAPVPPEQVQGGGADIKSSLPSLDFSPEEPKEERETTGARSSAGSLSSIERRRRAMARLMLLGGAAGLLAYGFYLGREWEEDELKARKLVGSRIYAYFPLEDLCVS